MKPKWLKLSRIILVLIIVLGIFHFISDMTKIQQMHDLEKQGISPDEAFTRVHFLCGLLNGMLFLLIALWVVTIIFERNKQAITQSEK